MKRAHRTFPGGGIVESNVIAQILRDRIYFRSSNDPEVQAIIESFPPMEWRTFTSLRNDPEKLLANIDTSSVGLEELEVQVDTLWDKTKGGKTTEDILLAMALEVLYFRTKEISTNVLCQFVEAFTAFVKTNNEKAKSIVTYCFVDLLNHYTGVIEENDMATYLVMEHFQWNMDLDSEICKMTFLSVLSKDRYLDCCIKMARGGSRIITSMTREILMIIDRELQEFSEKGLECLKTISRLHNTYDNNACAEVFECLPRMMYHYFKSSTSSIGEIDVYKPMTSPIEDFDWSVFDPGKGKIDKTSFMNMPILEDDVESPFTAICETGKEVVQRVVKMLDAVEPIYSNAFFRMLKLEFDKDLEHDILAVFIELVWMYDNGSRIIEFMPLIFKAHVFHSKNDISNPFKVNIVERVVNGRYELISHVLSQLRDFPISFAEMIALFNQKIAVSRERGVTSALWFLGDQNLNLIFECARKLQTMAKMGDSSNELLFARKSIFVFLMQLICLQREACLESSLFIHEWMKMSFEVGVSSWIINFIVNALKQGIEREELVTPLAEFVGEALLVAEDSELIEGFSNIALSCKDTKTCMAFAKRVDEFLTYLERRKHLTVLRNMLRILIRADADIDYMSISRQSRLAKIVRAYPMNETQQYLFGLVSSSECNGLGTRYLVKHPCFLLMICATYGTMEKFGDVIHHFQELCDYSMHNIVALHKGKLDEFLIRYISGGGNEFMWFDGGMDIRISLCKYEFEKVLILEKTISSYVSNGIVASEYVMQTCQSSNAEFLKSVFIKITNEPRYQYTLGGAELVPDVVIQSETLSHEFFVTFSAKLDSMLLAGKDNSFEMNMLTLFNDHYRIGVYLTNSTLVGYYDAGDSITRVEMCKISSYNKWTEFRLDFLTRKQNGLMKIMTHVNGMFVSNGILREGQLRGAFSLKLGDKPKTSEIYGYIANLRLWTSDTKCVYEFKEDRRQMSNVLDYFALNATKMFSICELDNYDLFVLTASIYGEIFSYSEKAQKLFPIDHLVEYLEETTLDFSVFQTIIDLFRLITVPELISSWLCNIIMNLKLWKKCDSRSRFRIISHLTNIEVERNADTIGSNNVFSEILSVFEDFSADTATKEQFIILLVKVGVMKLTEDDVDNLCCQLERDPLSCLIIMNDLSAEIVALNKQDVCLLTINKLFMQITYTNNHIIISNAFIAIHELSNPETRCYNIFTQIAKVKYSEVLLHSINAVLVSYPYLIPVACYLALCGPVVKRTTTIRAVEMSASFGTPTVTAPWLLWPLMLAVNRAVEPESKEHICRALTHVKNVEEHMSLILKFFVANDAVDLEHYFLETLAQTIPKQCAEKCLELIFFHPQTILRTHSPDLLALYNESPFRSPEEPTMTVSVVKEKIDLFHAQDVDSVKLTMCIRMNNSMLVDHCLMELWKDIHGEDDGVFGGLINSLLNRDMNMDDIEKQARFQEIEAMQEQLTQQFQADVAIFTNEMQNMFL